MPTQRKQELVKELEEILSRVRIAILTDYRGLKVNEITDLRRRLGEVGAEYRVVKNSLTRLAAKQAGREGINQILDGPTAIAYSYDDVTAPAKAVTDFIRATRSQLTVQGAIIDDVVLSVADVTELARLPSRDVMLGRLMGAMQSPIAGLVGVLNAVPAGLARVIQARKEQLEGAS